MTVDNDSDERLLVDELVNLERKLSSEGQSKRDRSLLKSHVYEVPLQSTTESAETSRVVSVLSWRMQDWAYKQMPCPFPTKARGLFTCTDPAIGRAIVVRGYDKFFNVGEVSWTQWTNIPNFAQGPFYLTVKSNGCIIFISALSPTQLIVTSKHAWGMPTQSNGQPSHASKGDEWLDQSLARAGKSRQDLCEYLWQNQCTAVAELCDDSFEEHVLAYAPEQTGLHLHGINANTRDLRTLPPGEVAQKAAEFGFIPTEFVVLDTIEEVKAFTTQCEQDDGRWNGTHVEGFVVRAPVSHTSDCQGESTSTSLFGRETFMFKVKFEQPYLRWRNWRELTRRMLSNRTKRVPYMEDGLLYGVNLKKIDHPHTKAYVEWAAAQLHSDPDSFSEWQHSRGIVRTRNEFLEQFQQTTPISPQEEEVIEDPNAPAVFDKTLIVPIAVPGCGKTAVSLALASLFGFAHTQSDDVQAKNPKKLFLASVSTSLKSNQVVIADRNNHLEQHRAELHDLLASKALAPFNVRTIALWWDIDSLPSNEVHEVCADRIMSRGDRHQSLRADASGYSHEAVLRKFIYDHVAFDPVANGKSDGRFNEIIRLDPTCARHAMLDDAISGLRQAMPELVEPSNEAREEAIAAAAAYKPSIFKIKEIKAPPARYYGIRVDVELEAFVRSCVSASKLPSTFLKLANAGEITQKPHVTLVHHKEVERERSEPGHATQVWEECSKLAKLPESDALDVAVTVGPRLVFTNSVVALEVSSLEPSDRLNGVLPPRDASPHTFHITVGFTKEAGGAVEGKHAFTALVKGQTVTDNGHNVQSIDIGTHKFTGRIHGMY